MSIRDDIGSDIEDIPFALDEFLVNVDGDLKVEVDVDGKRHTVRLRQPLEFEDELIDQIIRNTGKRRRGANVPIKGFWINGWLETKGEDYINNIWHNYQFFLKYLEGTTKNFDNVATHTRAPGTYDSMHRYIVALEDLGLVDRHRKEFVEQSEYDFFVPQEFRTRTYVQAISGIEEEFQAWKNPIETLYGEKEEEQDEPAPEAEREEPIEPTEEPEEPEVESEDGKDIGDLEGLEPENAVISQFEEQEELASFIDTFFEDAVEESIVKAPVDTEGIDETDYNPGRIGIFGDWAEGTAVPGETPLSFVIGVDDTNAEVSPTFIPSGVQANLEVILNEQNVVPEIFPEYDVLSFYNSVFNDRLRRLINQTDGERYYDLREQRFVSP